MKNKKLFQKTKYFLLRSFLVSEKKKKALLKVLPTFSEKQLLGLHQALLDYEAQAKPLVRAGFASEQGPHFLSQLKQVSKKIKRDAHKQHEKEHRLKEEADLDDILNF
jgi:hypothetical protein